MTADAILFWLIAIPTGACAIATVVTQNIVRAATFLLFTLAGTSGIFFLLGADLVGAIQLLVYVGGTLVLVIFGVMLTAQGPFIHMKASGAEWAASAIVGMLLMGVLALSALAIRKPHDDSQTYTLSNVYRLGVAVPAGETLQEHQDPRKHPLVEYAPADRLVRLTPSILLTNEYQRKIEKAETAEEKQRLEQERDEKLAKLPTHEAANSPYTDIIGQGFMGRPVGPAHTERVQRAGLAKYEVTRANYLFPFEIVSVHLLVVLIGAAYLARAKRRRSQSPEIAGGPEGGTS